MQTLNIGTRVKERKGIRKRVGKREVFDEKKKLETLRYITFEKYASKGREKEREGDR